MSKTSRELLENKDKPISDVLRWTPTHGHTSVSQPAKMYIDLLCAESRRLPKNEGGEGRIARESQSNPYCRQELLVMTMMMILYRQYGSIIDTYRN